MGLVLLGKSVEDAITLNDCTFWDGHVHDVKSERMENKSIVRDGLAICNITPFTARNLLLIRPVDV